MKDTASANEATPLQEDKEESGIGNCLCCRIVAPIRFGFLGNNRRKALQLAHCVCAFSLLLMTIGFFGAYSSGHVLSYVSWMTFHGPNGIGYAGVRSVCTPERNGSEDVKCQTWSEFHCKADMCELCKTQSMGMLVSIFIGCITYYTFYRKTEARLQGNDNNCTKFMSCFSAFVGGTNFGLSMIAYWQTCVMVADKLPNMEIHAGPGCWCISIATLLKVFMGFLHLGLPVEHAKAESV
mmetsp:Transcript_16672/g.35324  ORF Transcript_16672/g.35324 Transcript_16672/m.35324 type:complete len:238 (-) Transcript_16672:92-805(-)